MKISAHNSIRDTIRKVKETIARYGMIDPEDVIIVAVSGGPDSVCLLDILHGLMKELKIRLVVAHYDHGLRPAEDESETQFVHRFAASMNLPFETEKASLNIEEKTSSIEEKAREARYGFLERLKNRFHAKKIAVGHNLNDQAETVIMRLLRGSGPSGLAGIPPCRDNKIIRPLIEIKREEIESYLNARKISYVTDSSNLKASYLRNKIRLELMPELLKYQPRLIEHLGRMSVILRDENEYLDLKAEEWVQRESELRPDGDILIPISSFTGLPRSLGNRTIRCLLMKIGGSLRRIDQSHIQSVYNLTRSKKPQGIINLPNGLMVKKVYDRLAFTAKKKKPEGFLYTLEGPGTFYLEQIEKTISLVEMEGSVDLNMRNSLWTGYFDADKLEYPLAVRNFHKGDRFVPFGMRGHKKIKDFFIDLKIPSEIRASTPILISQDIPVWVCGYRIDERFKVTPDTKKILKVAITRGF